MESQADESIVLTEGDLGHTDDEQQFNNTVLMEML